MKHETTTADAETKTTKAQPVDHRTATLLITAHGARAKGFTFAKGATVPGVPLAHAEYLQSSGMARITEVKA